MYDLGLGAGRQEPELGGGVRAGVRERAEVGSARRPPAPAPVQAGLGGRAQREARGGHQPPQRAPPPRPALQAERRRADGGALHHLRRASPRGNAGLRGAPRAPDARGGAGARGGHPVAHQDPVSSPQLAKHALEAPATRALLGGFEHESFYVDALFCASSSEAAAPGSCRLLPGRLLPGRLVLREHESCSMGGSCRRQRRPAAAKRDGDGGERDGMASDGELTVTALGTEPGFNCSKPVNRVGMSILEYWLCPAFL
jgi:hypothetical protein